MQQPVLNQQFGVEKNPEYVEKTKNFMFCCSVDAPAIVCCCGCTLKTGVMILSILCIIGESLGVLNTSLNKSVTGSFLAISICFHIMNLIAYSLMLFGLCNKNVVYSYWGYFTNVIIFYLKLLWYIIIVILLIAGSSILVANNCSKYVGREKDYCDQSYKTALFAVITGVFLVAVVEFTISIYWIWILFSFTRHLANGDWGIIEGFYPVNTVVVVNQGIPIGGTQINANSGFNTQNQSAEMNYNAGYNNQQGQMNTYPYNQGGMSSMQPAQGGMTTMQPAQGGMTSMQPAQKY